MRGPSLALMALLLLSAGARAEKPGEEDAIIIEDMPGMEGIDDIAPPPPPLVQPQVPPAPAPSSAAPPPTGPDTAAPAPGTDAAAVPPAQKEVTLESFVAELNKKIGTYASGDLVSARCDRVLVKPLTPGLRSTFDLWLTGPSRCMPVLIPQPGDAPDSQAMNERIMRESSRLKSVLEDVCKTWITATFGGSIELPSAGEVRLVETQNRYFRIHWEEKPYLPPDPKPRLPSEIKKWEKREAEKAKVKGPDVYILLKSDLSELKRIRREKEFRLLDHEEFGFHRSRLFLKRYRHVREDHRSEARFEYRRAARSDLPGLVTVTWWDQPPAPLPPVGADPNTPPPVPPAPKPEFYEVDFGGCMALEKAPEKPNNEPPHKEENKP